VGRAIAGAAQRTARHRRALRRPRERTSAGFRPGRNPLRSRSTRGPTLVGRVPPRRDPRRGDTGEPDRRSGSARARGGRPSPGAFRHAANGYRLAALLAGPRRRLGGGRSWNRPVASPATLRAVDPDPTGDRGCARARVPWRRPSRQDASAMGGAGARLVPPAGEPRTPAKPRAATQTPLPPTADAALGPPRAPLAPRHATRPP
jgi:hypothetical protein